MYFPLGARERILSAGLKLFSRRGFENTPVPLIAKYARVGLNTFYRYFRDKEELVNEVYRDLRRRLSVVLDVAARGGDTPRQQFRELWQQMVEFDREHAHAIAFLEHRHHGAYLDEHSAPLERVPQPIVDLIERLGRRGAVKNAPPLVLAAVVWGTFVELLKLESQGRLPLSPEKLRAAEMCLWDAISAPQTGDAAVVGPAVSIEPLTAVNRREA